jgi:PilZ domain
MTGGEVIGSPAGMMSDSNERDAAKRNDLPPDSGPERREDERHFACFPAHIQRPGGSTRMALIRDLSVSGALLFTRVRVEVGDEIRLNLYLSEDMTDVRPAVAHVVRSVPRTADRAEVWHHSVAVRFATPLLDCEAEIKDLADRQAALGIPRD